ncbi:UPF0472 protein C16orf72 homolog [Lingula anatina]|uniref:UPF0472 protein C16orf72 homolog n=1 Tax=Lingula anatina TaxID=7574 RepID=A0A1S3HQW3_LINAN|nr:UPF0472 protein C16orf72 homolog [Lingula anatina]|eukprot:XP_013388430.1 UPF0472 protein C16orf72 homolog [Lingula anatina]
MDDDHDREQERFSDHWLKKWEDQCLEELENESNMDDQIQAEREESSQKLWHSFQNAATALAQLYKDRSHGFSMWMPFQNAAGSVTVLYKESADNMKRWFDLGIQCGQQRKTRDIVAWAKKRRRHIRREDLIAFLSGKNPPPRHRPSPTRSRGTSHMNFTECPPAVIPPAEPEPDLQTFREALALQGLNGAMSNVNMGYMPHSQGSPVRNRSSMEELNIFILDELSRHNDRKRTSSGDVIMDSPTRKRSRLL